MLIFVDKMTIISASVQYVLVFLFLISDVELYETIRNGCTTPAGRSGRCTRVRRCQPLKKLIEDSKQLDVGQKVREQYSCGRNKVCCPSGAILAESGTPEPPDLRSHKNVKLLPDDCGYIDINDKIRNGENAGFNEFPWMVLLSYETPNGPSFQCGGTIINERYILTAAHCVVNLSFTLKKVRIGEYNLGTEKDCLDINQETCNPPVQDLDIEKVIYPEDYNVTLFANDIALVRVSKINLKADNAVPVCLPIDEEIRKMEFNKGIVTGWGFTDPHETADVLQRVVLEKRPLSVCVDTYSIKPDIKLNHKQLCVGGVKQKQACPGDSGGPIHMALYFNDESRYVQFGIVSIGPLYCGYDGVPGIYTRVIYYTEWIMDNLEP